MELFKLLGTIAVENTQANEDIDETTEKAEGSEGKISGAFKKIGAAVMTFFAVDKIKDFGLSCIESAANASAASSQFSQVFGEMETQAAEHLSGISDNAGILENRLKGSYTQIAAFAKTTGMDTADALGLADRAMVAVADSAAFYDRSLEETTESLQSFLKGNYENDAALGLSCTEVTRNEAANKLYGKSFIQLSEDQKQLTLLQMVEDANKASGALGQAARESDTWGNVLGNLQQSWTDFKAILGDSVLPVAVSLVKKMAGAVQSLTEKVPVVTAWLKEHETVLTIVGAAIAGVTAGMVAYKAAMAIGGVITAAQNALHGLTLAQYALSLAISLNPIGLFVAAIGGLIAILVACYMKFETFRNIVNGVWNSIKTIVSTTISNVKTTISNGMELARNTVTTVLDGIKRAFTDKLNSAKDIVKGAIDKIKGFFNFSWKLPDLKLPHFSIKGKFSLSPPEVPDFGISWYKKAMDEPYMFTKPTVFGLNGGMKGAGEAGDEIMIGKEAMLSMIRKAVAEVITGGNARMIELLELLTMWFVQGGFTGTMVDILTKYVGVDIDGREVLRLVKKYA